VSLPYPLRLLCLCLASFFLVHLALGLLVSLLCPLAVRLAKRLPAGLAARLLLGLRLFPPAASLLVVAGLCVPSYLWLETEAGAERVGFACLAAALSALAIGGMAIARGWRAARRSLRYSRDCRRAGRETRLPGEAAPVWIVEGQPALLALAGILRPRIFISRQLVDSLSAGELSAALSHERAHRLSRDNFKRLCLLLAPDAVPFHSNFAALEHAWARSAEWAADDRAAAGDSLRSLSLASALVRTARMGPWGPASFLVTSLLDSSLDFSERVERLLCGAPPAEGSAQFMTILTAGSAVLLAISLAAMAQPGALASVHGLLERLVR